jgi:hypothetical protein
LYIRTLNVAIRKLMSLLTQFVILGAFFAN